MVMRRKAFSTYNEPSGSDDVVLLEINDQVGDKGFRCQPTIPGIFLIRWIAGLDESNPAAVGASVETFLKAAIKPDEWQRFDDYISNPEHKVELTDLSEMAGWLASQYTGNPTQSSSDSSAGSSTNGLGPTAVHSGVVATSERSEPESSSPFSPAS